MGKLKITTLHDRVSAVYLAYEATLPDAEDKEIGLYDTGQAQIHQEICDDLAPLYLAPDREELLVDALVALRLERRDMAPWVDRVLVAVYGGEEVDR